MCDRLEVLPGRQLGRRRHVGHRRHRHEQQAVGGGEVGQLGAAPPAGPRLDGIVQVFKVATGAGKMLTSQFYIAGDPGNERDGVFRGIREPRQRELVEMKLQPASGLEAGALATAMDIVVA